MPDDIFDMFKQIGEDDPPKDKAPAGGTVTLSQEQFDALLAKQNAESERNMRMWEQVLAGKQAPAAPATDQLPQFQVDLSGLPDPRDDYDGYHKGLGERLSKSYVDMEATALERVSQKLAATQNQEQLVNNLWAKLQQDNPEFAENPEIAELASTRYANGLRAKGIDPIQAMRTNFDDVVKGIAENGTAMLRKIRGEADQGADPGRTKMVQGNGSSRGRAKAAASAEVEQPNDFVNDLKSLQRNMRIY